MFGKGLGRGGEVEEEVMVVVVMVYRYFCCVGEVLCFVGVFGDWNASLRRG